LNAEVLRPYSAWVRNAERSLLLAFALAAVMIFARLGELPLRDPDEGRNTEVAREMHLAGAWLTPTYNGLVYLDKPCFFFKFVSLSLAAFGENEAAARLPSAIAATAILLMVAGFCRREYDDKTAALAVVALSTAPSFIALARHVIFDMMLGAFVCGAIFAGYYAEAAEGKRARNLRLLGATLSGFATLVKGPVGFVVPTLVLGVFSIFDKRAGWWKRHFHPLNLAVFFAVTLPWFIGLSILHPDFPRYGLYEESFRRFTTPVFSRSAPFYYFGLVILGGLFAWSALLPEAIAAAWQRRAQLTRADRLLIVWSIVVVIFFSLSKSKLPHYILSAIVALSILVGRVFAIALQRPTGRAAALIFRSLVILLVLSLGLVAFLVINIHDPNAHETLFKIRSREFENVALTFPTVTVLFSLIAVFAFAARISKNVRIALATFLVLPLSIVTFGFPAVKTYSEASSSRALALEISKLSPQPEIASLRAPVPGLPYYLKRPIHLITSTGAEISPYVAYSLRDRADWPEGVVKESAWENWLATQTNNVLLLADRHTKKSLEAFATRHDTNVCQISPGWWGMLVSPRK
jgi:4-amino-4-deoxy-L-arabinose transferase-like glycosyltransferase